MTTETPTRLKVVAEDLEVVRDRLSAELALLAGKRLLITGGAGFLGYYLVQSVAGWESRPDRAPEQVIVCDNFMRGLPGWIAALRDLGRIQVLQHDISQALPNGLGDLDFVIHAASIASPTYYRRHPIETMDANVGGLRHLLELCLSQQRRGKPVQGLLFCSTSEIYGDPDPASIPTPETYRGSVSCTGPRSCYDESKRYGETLCVNFARQHGIPVVIVRPFNNYGPGLRIDDGRVIPDFARNILAGQDIAMISDGSPSRTYCYVTDAVVGYYRALLRGRGGESYNIGADAPEISIAALAAKMSAIAAGVLGYRGKVVHATSGDRHYLTDNPQRRCPDLSKARRELQYEPRVSLEDGLTRTLLWYRDDPHGREARP